MNSEAAPPGKSTGGTLRKNAILMASGVGVSRLTGLLREQVFAWLFGAGVSAEAFVAAMRIPNFFRDLLAENISTSAVVPVYSSIREKDGREEATRFANGSLTMFFVLSSLIAAVGIILAPLLVSLFTPGFSADPERSLLTIRLTRTLFPFLVLVSIAALFQAIQNAENRFFVPAVSSGVLNIVFIAAGWWFSTVYDPPIIGMALGMLAGGLATVVFLAPGYLRAIGGRAQLQAFWAMDSIHSLAFMVGPLVLGVAAVQINMLVNTIVASFAEPGAIPYLNYAYRVMHLPLGLIAVTLSTAALPALARSFHADNMAEFTDTLNSAMSYALVLSIPAATGLIILRTDVIGVLYQYGRFTLSDLENTAGALAAYAIGIPAFSMNRVFSAGYYARKDSRTPVKIGAVGVLANILLNILALLAGAGFVGIAAAASAAGWVQTLLYLARSNRENATRPFASFGASAAGVALGVCLMIAGIYAVRALGVQHRILRTALEIAVGGGLYSAAAFRKHMGYSKNES